MGSIGLLSLLPALALATAASDSSRFVQYQSNTRSVVVVAHQDDWQLFMGDVIAAELKKGSQVTFVYLTAGDDGRDSLYWRTRERAALRSTATAMRAPFSDTAEQCATALVTAHPIRECVLGSTRSYFLRLPDGNRNGAGFTRYGNESLRKLRKKASRSITAVDRSTRYSGWDDLITTVGELISMSSVDGKGRVHTTDPSIAINPHDHFDHRLAGYMVADLRGRLKLAPMYYVGYALGTRAPNRNEDQVRDKTAVFGSYDREMTRVNSKWSAYVEHPAFYSQCMLRTYHRTGRPARH